MTLGNYFDAHLLCSTYREERTMIFVSEPSDVAPILRNALNPFSVNLSDTSQLLTHDKIDFPSKTNMFCSQY